MRFPKQTKYRKLHRSGGSSRGSKIQSCKYPSGNGLLALVSLGSGRCTSRQLEAGRIVISRGTKRNAFLSMPAFPDFGVTAKAERSRMGKGKGNLDYWVFVTCPGDILYSLEGGAGMSDSSVLDDWALVLSKAGDKRPFATSVVYVPKFPSSDKSF